MAGPFDDELSEDEQKLLSSNEAIPPAADEDGDPGNSVDAAVADAAVATPAAPAAPAEAAAPAPAEPEVPVDDAALAEFLEKHKDKSPEDLARLAFQQQKRANREAHQNRKVGEAISSVAAKARAAAERREQLAKSVPTIKEQFKQKLEADPDGATEELFNSIVDARLAEADADAATAQVDEAIVFAETHIPEFGARWPEMHGLANEVGFSNDELNEINDGRTLVILSLAAHTARLMKAGVMDRYGNLAAVPQGEPTTLDPRLAAPDPQRTLGGGARTARSSQSIDQQLQALASMSEEEFARMDPKEIERLLRVAA